MLSRLLALKVDILMPDTHTHLKNRIVPLLFWLLSSGRIEMWFKSYSELLEKRIILHEGRKNTTHVHLEECGRGKCLHRLMSRSAVH